MQEIFDNITADTLFLQGNYREAFEHYFHGATILRDSRAAFDVAFMYQYGYHVPTNYAMARRFYHAASGMESGEPLFNLALMEIRGLGKRADFAQAYRHMEQSAAMGCIDAQLYLGTAFTLGCIFDPINIECLSLIPFYRVIPRDPTQVMLTGTGKDTAQEDERFSVIEPDEQFATEMFARAAAHPDNPYVNAQIGSARLALGQALLEGFGREYHPQKGYRLIERAAIENDSREAKHFLVEHGETARLYGINMTRAKALLEEK